MQRMFSGGRALRWASQRQPMSHSVVRRSLYITVFFIGGHAFYYLLVLAANARLSPVDFGRFYLGWATLNILVAPGSVLTLSLSGHFAAAYRQNGTSGVIAALRAAGVTLLPSLLILTGAIELVLLFGGMAIGTDAVITLALLPLTALSSVMVDIIRAVFQGALRFVWFGASWLFWCFGQCVLGSVVLVLIREPWAVFLGMLGANCLTLVCLLVVTWRMGVHAARDQPTPAAQPAFPVQSLWRLLPFCTALGSFVVLSNADILIAYLKLTSLELGAYAASAILPKAIVTATQPVTQVILPLTTHIRGESLKIREALLKAIGLTFALAALGAGALWLISGEACGGHYGIKFCDSAVLLVLAIGAVAVSVTRTAIIADLLGDRRWRPHLPVVALVAFAAVNWLGRPSAIELAIQYSILCWLLLLVLVAAKLLEWRRIGGGPSLKPAVKR
jgi:O-antigen/teichoic acid export membrane protein